MVFKETVWNKFIFPHRWGGFIPAAWRDDGTYNDETWPQDAVLLTDDEATSFWKQNPPDGKTLGSIDGRPAWVDVPPMTHEQLVQIADNERVMRIAVANDFINGKQWPSKLMLGRLSVADKFRFNAWLDYTDELQAVDTSKAPDIEWPVAPV